MYWFFWLTVYIACVSCGKNVPCAVTVAVSRKWSVPDTVSTVAKPEARTGLSVVHFPMARCLYVYGGSKNKKWFSDVYMVDTDNWSWHCIKVSCVTLLFRVLLLTVQRQYTCVIIGDSTQILWTINISVIQQNHPVLNSAAGCHTSTWVLVAVEPGCVLCFGHVMIVYLKTFSWPWPWPCFILHPEPIAACRQLLVLRHSSGVPSSLCRL